MVWNIGGHEASEESLLPGTAFAGAGPGTTLTHNYNYRLQFKWTSEYKWSDFL